MQIAGGPASGSIEKNTHEPDVIQNQHDQAMGLTERVWDALCANDPARRQSGTLTATIAKQQNHIEDLTGRVILLETALELALGARRSKRLSGPGS